jgi:hypothetical protein
LGLNPPFSEIFGNFTCTKILKTVERSFDELSKIDHNIHHIKKRPGPSDLLFLSFLARSLHTQTHAKHTKTHWR